MRRVWEKRSQLTAFGIAIFHDYIRVRPTDNFEYIACDVTVGPLNLANPTSKAVFKSVG